MSLIKCTECGKEISDSSNACIHCGNPIKKKLTCPECKKEINEEDKVCKNCGNLLKEDKKEIEKEKKKKKTPIIVIGVIVAIIAIIVIIYLSTTVKVPYLYNIDSNNAENILTSNNLIPEIIYEYDDYIEEGKVIDTNPYSDQRISKNSIVTIYVSKGPKTITSSDSTISWQHITDYAKDDWNFYSPRIEDGYLYIDCHSTFAKDFYWSNGNGGESGFGRASINDTFSKTVPVEIIYENQFATANTEQNFTLKLSVNDLDVKKPTTLYYKLFAEVAGEQFEISINFAIAW